MGRSRSAARAAITPDSGGRLSGRELLLLFALVVPLAVGLRWSFSAESGQGEAFHPRPDALEYVASAQALADSGRFYLQVQGSELRPRYAPGLPLFVASALTAGVAPSQVWRLNGVIGGLLALLIAVVVARLTAARCAGAHRSGPLLAGGFAGLLWATAPVLVYHGGLVLTDEPAALLQIGCLGAVVLGARAAGRSRHAWLLLAGLLLGTLATWRPSSGVLLGAPLLVLLLPMLATDAADACRAAALVMLGAIPPLLITLAVLHGSGYPPWPWDAYAAWDPANYVPFSSTFHPRFAIEGSGMVRPFLEPRPHWQHTAAILLGLPGLVPFQSAGLLWPALGWSFGLWRFATDWRDTGAPSYLGLALATFVVCTSLVFSLYFFASTRFYFAPLAIAAGLAGCALGQALGSGRRGLVVAALIVGLGSLGTNAVGLRSLWTELWRPGAESNARTEQALEAWLARSQAERASLVLPFNSVQAQALGLLPASRAAQVGEWGRLARTSHTTMIAKYRHRGFLDGVVDHVVRGWVCPLDAAGQIAWVRVFADGQPLGWAVAERLRPDLSIATAGGERCGFEYSLPDALRDGEVHEIRAEIEGTGVPLPGSPIRYRFDG